MLRRSVILAAALLAVAAAGLAHDHAGLDGTPQVRDAFAQEPYSGGGENLAQLLR